MSDSETETEEEDFSQDFQFEPEEIASGYTGECLSCNEEFRYNHGMSLCYHCASKFTITKTEAKKVYGLKDADFEDLICINWTNMHRSTTNLYMLKQIRLRVIEEHYGVIDPDEEQYEHLISEFLQERQDARDKRAERREELAEKRERRKRKLMRKIEKAAEKRDLILHDGARVIEAYLEGKASIRSVIREARIWTVNQAKRERRKHKLEKALAKYNLKIRADSFYCKSYIEGGLDDGNGPLIEDHVSLKETVDMMRIMDFMANQTNYFQIIKRKIQDEYDFEKGCGCWDGQRIEADEGMKQEAKMQAVREFVCRRGKSKLPDIIRETFCPQIEAEDKKQKKRDAMTKKERAEADRKAREKENECYDPIKAAYHEALDAEEDRKYAKRKKKAEQDSKWLADVTRSKRSKKKTRRGKKSGGSKSSRR